MPQSKRFPGPLELDTENGVRPLHGKEALSFPAPSSGPAQGHSGLDAGLGGRELRSLECVRDSQVLWTRTTPQAASGVFPTRMIRAVALLLPGAAPVPVLQSGGSSILFCFVLSGSIS